MNLTEALTTFTLLAQTGGKSTGLLGNPLIMMGIMIVMFYFLLIRPQQRQRKEQEARIAALQNGDKVITTAGIHGIVHNVKEKTVVIKVAEGTMIEFDKPAVASVQKKESSN
ncbi:MAG: preprotein translocase subunit YajC [Verrucomicrobiales bacterium]|nr:preprotein translocase subunit YajC [Verrucomicrobiota bacterium JB025]